MYVFQFEDASYRIALSHPARHYHFDDLLKNRRAYQLYEGIYETRDDAYAALNEIRNLLDK